MNEKIIERSQRQVHGSASSYNISNVIVSNAISIIQSSNLIKHTPKCWVEFHDLLCEKGSQLCFTPKKNILRDPDPKHLHIRSLRGINASNRGGLRSESVHTSCSSMIYNLQYTAPLLCIVISCSICLVFIICVSEWFWMVLVQTEFRLCPSDPFWHEHSSCFSARNP